MRWVMPRLQRSVTRAPSGNPDPATITTVPGWPTAGVTSSRARDAAPRRATVRREATRLSAIDNVAARAPLPVGLNTTLTVHASLRFSVRPLHASATTRKSDALVPEIPDAPTVSGDQPAFASVAAAGRLSVPTA